MWLSYRLTADAVVLLNPVERVVHEATVAAHVVPIAVDQLLRRTGVGGEGQKTESTTFSC